MNETLKVLETRRSVRKFKSDPIPDDVLDQILTAGTYAPTGMGQQSPVIIVVNDRKTRDAIAAKNTEIGGWDKGFDPFYGAPTILLVAAKKRPTDVYDGSCVICNLMNAAWSLGVGSCWIHRAEEVFDLPEGRALLEKWGLPATLRGVGHCILGYADGPAPAPKPRRDGRIVRV